MSRKAIECKLLVVLRLQASCQEQSLALMRTELRAWCTKVLQNQPATPSCDLWALGCILFEFFAASPPFNANTEYLIFQKIQALQ